LRTLDLREDIFRELLPDIGQFVSIVKVSVNELPYRIFVNKGGTYINIKFCYKRGINDPIFRTCYITERVFGNYGFDGILFDLFVPELEFWRHLEDVRSKLLADSQKSNTENLETNYKFVSLVLEKKGKELFVPPC
jgi:hypothetical protein